METFSDLVEYVEENFGGEVINPGRRKEIILVIHNDDFNEDELYDVLLNWDGSYKQTEEVEDYEDIEESVVVYTGLCVDLDGESLIPVETDSEDEEEDEEDWDDDSVSEWNADEDI